MHKEGQASVVEERTRRGVAIAETGGIDEVGASEGEECHLEGNLEVKSPQDQDLEPGRFRCPPKAGVGCQWRWAVGVKRTRLVQKELRASVVE